MPRKADLLQHVSSSTKNWVLNKEPSWNSVLDWAYKADIWNSESPFLYSKEKFPKSFPNNETLFKRMFLDASCLVISGSCVCKYISTWQKSACPPLWDTWNCHHKDPCNSMAVPTVQAQQISRRTVTKVVNVTDVTLEAGMVTYSDFYKMCFKCVNHKVHNVQYKTIQLWIPCL